jgi:threonine aldolase
MDTIDLRSDTVTEPTGEMRRAMAEAIVGDDHYGDDPTTRQLEEMAASLLGKEAALFVPSGTFGNELALYTHCRRGDEVIAGEQSHIVCHEGGAPAIIAGVNIRTVPVIRGSMDPNQVEALIRKVRDISFPKTALIEIENANSDGTVMPLENMAQIRQVADRWGIPIHLDGARIFHGAAALNTDARRIASFADSAMVCLSKGLCAPIGSLLLGSRDFISRALYGRKIMGGAMRQTGILAAAGIIALQRMTGRVTEDNQNARLLEQLLAGLPGVEIRDNPAVINMVFFRLNSSLPPTAIQQALQREGIRVSLPEENWYRFCTHHGVTRPQIRQVAETLGRILQKGEHDD